MSSKAALKCFPNVAQQTVTADDVENMNARGGLDASQQTLPFLNREKAALAIKCFNPIRPKPTMAKPTLAENLRSSGTLPTNSLGGVLAEAGIWAFWRDLGSHTSREVMDL